MSVIVKGMDMPKNCAYCPLSEYRNTSLGQILDCKRIVTVGSAVRGTHDVLNHRHPNCPLVDSPESHWIPVTDRLPYAEYGESDNVLATCGYRDVEDGSIRWIKTLYFNGDNWCYPTGETYLEKVYAWMPLPEPYKGVTT